MQGYTCNHFFLLNSYITALLYIILVISHIDCLIQPCILSQICPLPLPLKSVLIKRTNRCPNVYYSRSIQSYFVLSICQWNLLEHQPSNLGVLMCTIHALFSPILYYLYVTHLNTTDRPTLHSFPHIPLFIILFIFFSKVIPNSHIIAYPSYIILVISHNNCPISMDQSQILIVRISILCSPLHSHCMMDMA